MKTNYEMNGIPAAWYWSQPEDEEMNFEDCEAYFDEQVKNFRKKQRQLRKEEKPLAILFFR